MATDKQERTVVHLELGAEHYYFGSVKALCANIGITPDKPYRNKYCTIRKGILLTAPKVLSDSHGK